MNTVLNLGSINIDYVYRVDHFVTPGETLGSTSLTRGAGGKGYNQSIALARAGARVRHAGCLGREALWLREALAAEQVDVSRLAVVEAAPGHAIIQVIPSGQNAILLHAGANHALTAAAVPGLFAGLGPGDWFLAQNETSCVPEAIRQARAAGLTVCLNPAPMDPAVLQFPLDEVDYLFVNESEGQALTGAEDSGDILAALRQRCPHTYLVLTLGAEGVCCRPPGADQTVIRCAGRAVQAVDTTAAGDSFIGFFIASRLQGRSLEDSLQHATHAAALSVTRPGAADSIPFAHEISEPASLAPITA